MPEGRRRQRFSIDVRDATTRSSAKVGEHKHDLGDEGDGGDGFDTGSSPRSSRHSRVAHAGHQRVEGSEEEENDPEQRLLDAALFGETPDGRHARAKNY